MRIEYEYSFDLPRTIVWKYIKNEKILRNSLPNCTSFKESSTGIYHAHIEGTLGPIQDLFEIEVQRQKEKSPAFYHLAVKGKGKLGEFNGAADLYLKTIDRGTNVHLLGDAEVTGALAVAGQRAILRGADKSLNQFFKSVEREIKKSLYQKQRGRCQG